MDENKYCATGRRKESVARVKLTESQNPVITINKRSMDSFFQRDDLKIIVKQPLVLTQTQKKLNIDVNVAGGGIKGQAEAIRLGIARALVMLDETFKPLLKQNKLLTRDPRMRERKKYGQEGARRRFQFSKR